MNFGTAIRDWVSAYMYLLHRLTFHCIRIKGPLLVVVHSLEGIKMVSHKKTGDKKGFLYHIRPVARLT